MVITIASGKGGTGKTTVATNLALSIPDKVQLLDCDVEAPNSHLFLNPVLGEPEQVLAPVPRIDMEKCTLCRKCMDICRFGAIAVLKKDVMVFDNLCHSCGGCLAICPEGAVTEHPRSLGILEAGTAGNIEFIRGKLDIGQVMVPPIIKQVRTHTDEKAVTIIDAPPGTSCPVVTSLNKTDVAVLVTEPTPFGLHDLKLAVETVKIMGIPHGLVINRAGMGNDDVKEYAQENQIPILLEIPFEQRIAQVYSKGGMLVEEIPELKPLFLTLYENIKQLYSGRGEGV